MNGLIRITAPHFVAGIVPRQRWAPILAYMASWSGLQIYAYCQRKGWGFEWWEQ